MNLPSLTLFHSPCSPNARRVRVFLAEKGLEIRLIAISPVELETRSRAYRLINPQDAIPTLLLEDGTTIVEASAICQYIEETYPDISLLGTTAKEKALVTMWARWVEQEGFLVAMDLMRSLVPNLRNESLENAQRLQNPVLIELNRARLHSFHLALNAHLGMYAFVAGDSFSVADITALVTIEFTSRALNLPIHGNLGDLNSWYDLVSGRPSMRA